MTTQEIIRALRGLQVETGSLACLDCTHENSCSTKGCAILRQAAEALEKVQTIDNCISRQATIEAIEAECKIAHQEAQDAPCLKSFHDEQVIHRTLERIAMRMQSIPAADMQEDQRWIPCSERLPKEKQRVMVRCATVGTTVGWILWGEWMTDLGRGCADVTHWMPLPQPPKEVQGND